MLDKVYELIYTLANILSINDKWCAWLICFPLSVYWLFFTDAETIGSFFGENTFMWGVAITVLFWMWWCCRKQPLLWVLPYLCMGKFIFLVVS